MTVAPCFKWVTWSISPQGRPLFLQSSRNVSVNIVNSNNKLLTQLVTGKTRPEKRWFSLFSLESAKIHRQPLNWSRPEFLWFFSSGLFMNWWRLFVFYYLTFILPESCLGLKLVLEERYGKDGSHAMRIGPNLWKPPSIQFLYCYPIHDDKGVGVHPGHDRVRCAICWTGRRPITRTSLTYSAHVGESETR